MRFNKIKTWSKASLLLLAFGGGTQTWASVVPTRWNNCPNVQVQSVEGSNGYKMSKDCSTVYILPPAEGRLSLNGQPLVDPYLDRICQRIDALYDRQEVTDGLLGSLEKNLAQKVDRYNQMQENFNEGLIPIGITEDQYQEDIDNILETIDKLTTRFQTTEDRFNSSLDRYARQSGGEVGVFVETGFQELVDRFAAANEGSGLNFEKIPFDQGFLSFKKKNSSTRAEHSLVLNMSISGIGQMPVLRPLSDLIEQGIPQIVSPETDSTIFVSAAPGNIELSKLGACSLFVGNSKGQEVVEDKVASVLGAVATFEYPLMVQRSHSITFRMSNLVEIIHKQKRKGGLFSRKTLNKLIDNRDSSSWLEFHGESQDRRFTYTDEYKAEVKKQFLDRALKDIVAVQTQNPAAHLALLDPKGENGSDQIATELGKCVNLYCKIGAAGFRVLSKIFGSTQAVSHLKKTFEAEYSEVVTDSVMVPQLDTMVFK